MLMSTQFCFFLINSPHRGSEKEVVTRGSNKYLRPKAISQKLNSCSLSFIFCACIIQGLRGLAPILSSQQARSRVNPGEIMSLLESQRKDTQDKQPFTLTSWVNSESLINL